MYSQWYSHGGKESRKGACEQVNEKEVYLIHEPMAAAIGIGLDVMLPKRNLIVDIGGGTTEIAIIAFGGIICDKSIKIAGDVFTNDILFHMRTHHNLYVGEVSAESIKIEVGAATEELEEAPDDLTVRGKDMVTGKPKEVVVTFREIARALDKSIQRIEDAIMYGNAFADTTRTGCRYLSYGFVSRRRWSNASRS